MSSVKTKVQVKVKDETKDKVEDKIEDKVENKVEDKQESRPKDEIMQFRVSTNSNVHKLSSAIYKTYLEKTKFEIVAIGAGAINQTVKSLAEARGMLIKSGKDISFIPFFRDIESTKVAGGIVSAVVFALREV